MTRDEVLGLIFIFDVTWLTLLALFFGSGLAVWAGDKIADRILER